MGRTTSSRKSVSGPSSFLSSSGGINGGAVSQALKIRRYIDIQLKDVVDERARGKWTVEDDRLWKATKPYECEICGERGSTRYNNNRHKLNKHAIKKTIKCSEPGCKLSFTRLDNLVKHQKKHHPETLPTPINIGKPDGPEIEPRKPEPMGHLVESFRRFPIADDLPPGPVPGLKQYYQPDKLPFLPPEVLSHYVDYYFSPTAFHVHLPLLHKSTFRPVSVLASFLRSVCALGGRYDPTNKTLSEQLWESGWRVMERWIKIGPIATEDEGTQTQKEPMRTFSKYQCGKTEDTTREACHGPAILMGSRRTSDVGSGRSPKTIHSSIKEQSEKSAEKIKFPERKDREGRLCILQGLLLFTVYGLYSEDKDKHKKARRLLARCVEIAREYGYLREPEPLNVEGFPLQQQWEVFIERESQKRAAFTLYLVDCHMSLIFNTPHLLRTSELKTLTLPCDQQLFEAPTCQNWKSLWETRPLPGSKNVPAQSFWRSITILLKGKADNELTRSGDLRNDFSSLILVTALHMEILDLTRKFCEEDVEGARREQDSLFSDEWLARLNKLQQSLNTLGLISGYSHPSALEPSDHDQMRPYTSITKVCFNAANFPTKSTALEASKRQGCGRSFYISWQLAYIQLLVPDRMVLHGGDVPMDLYSAIAISVNEAKTRVSNANFENTMFSMLLENSDLLSHLLELMRFIAGQWTEDDEDARFTEFPVVSAMMFKALIIIWEVLVRTNSNESSTSGNQISSRRESYNDTNWAFEHSFENSSDWMFMSNTGTFDWSALPPPPPQHHSQPPESQRTVTAAEMFKNEVLGLLTRWEIRYEETEGLESLEWRYLRWLSNVFAEMKCWDVGDAVVKALEVLFGEESG